MNMFTRAKIFRNVTKIYFLIEKGEKFDLGWIRNNVFDVCTAKAENFQLNYGKEVNVAKLTRIVVGSTLQYLEVTDSVGTLILTLAARYEKDGSPTIYQLMVVNDCNAEFTNEQTLMSRVSSHLPLIYGYSRILREDYDPSTETKVRKGFISTSVEMEKKSSWMFEPNEMRTGGVKGVYPLNYWTDDAVDKLSATGFIISSIKKSPSHIYALSDIQKREIAQNNNKFKEFLRFDGIGT